MLSQTSVPDSISTSNDPLAEQPYRAVRLLGAGGMGEVFLAEHRTFGTPCVVKIQHARLARDPSIADRIRLEAESLSRLNHANIVSIFGTGQTVDARPYIVMEYLRGQTLADEFAARGQLPPLEALSYICQLLRGLAAAHAIGLVHRDVKPDNLFLCDGPRGNRLLKVLDFGVAGTTPEAQALGANPLAVPTATGTVVGALRYVSPEGALARRVDHRADLYSAALVLYFALAGRGPFDHIQSALLLLSAHVAEEPEPPSHFARAPIPPPLDQAILKALRKAPEERFQSADELREELERIMDQLRAPAEASELRRLPEAALGPADSSGARIRSARRVEVEESPADQSGPLLVGARFLEKYRIRKQIGRGGQAWVYLGEHIFTGREVAIKIAHSARGMTQEMLERGRAEARALGKLDHPNIVVMHDAGVTDDGSFYIVMELLRGRSLRSALWAHGHFSIREVLDLATSVADAVQAAHEIGLIHRDLTPDNVYLTRNNRVKVLDFGIAKMLNEIGFTTHKDIVMGSILYMSPEQVQGLALTPRSDVCALGLMMFEMLLGNHPSLLIFERDLREREQPPRRAALADIPPIQAHRTPPLLSELDANIPLDLAQVVSRAIAKDPEQRFATMREFSAAIRACKETYIGEAPITLRQIAERDLSQRMDGESPEPPSSQRVTPRRGLIWDGDVSVTPVPLQAELGSTTAVSASVARGRESFVTRRSARRRPVSALSKGLTALCVGAVALGSLGALRYLDASPRSAPATTALATAVTTPSTPNSMLASLSPALPDGSLTNPSAAVGTTSAASEARVPLADPSPPAPDEGVGPASRAPLAAPASHHLPAVHARRSTPSATTASANSVAAMIDVSRPLDIELGAKRSKDTTAKESRKKLNGGKLIYGD